MDQMLERIKERVAQRDSPVRTIKGLIGAIGMSEAGFYTMLKRGTTKQGTILAMAEALKVPPSFLEGNTNSNDSKASKNEDVLQAILQDVQEMKEVFEEQLRAKDRQIDGLQRTIDVLVGKSEGATGEPLSAELLAFNKVFNNYRGLALGGITETKNTAKRTSKVGGTPFSYAENTVTIK